MLYTSLHCRHHKSFNMAEAAIEEDHTHSVERKKYNHLFKVILIGDSNVGKTNLIQSFWKVGGGEKRTAEINVDFAIATLESSDGQIVKLQLWDTAGQERFKSITVSYFRGAHGILVVFDIDKKQTFDSLTHWLDLVQQMASPDTAVMIVGHKLKADKLNRDVSREEAQAFADAKNIIYEEASADSNWNIDTILHKLIDMMVKNKPKVFPPVSQEIQQGKELSTQTHQKCRIM